MGNFFLLFSLILSPLIWAKDKNTLVTAWETPPRSFDPRYSVDADSQTIENLLHCSLIDFDSKGLIIPALAQNWKWVDPKTLEFTLKDQIKFASGRSVDSEDVKATFEFLLKKDPALPASTRTSPFDKIQTVQATPGKITFLLSSPDAPLLSNLNIGILPKEAIQQLSGKILTAQDNVAGCGPYTLKEASVSHILLEANPYAGLEQKAKIAMVEIKYVKDEVTRFAKLQKEEIDLAQNNISLEQVTRVGKDYPNLQLLKTPGLKSSYIGFNTTDPILKDLRVRKAIAFSIQRDAIIKYILKDLAVESRTLLTPDNPYYNPNIPSVKYDPEQAKKLLEEAGFKVNPTDGYRFHLTFKTSTNLTRVAIGEAIASDLEKVGIKLTVESLEWGRFKDDVDKGKVQLWGLTWIGFKDPDVYRYAFATESFPPQGGNRGRFSNPELDQLLNQARITPEEGERRKLYFRAQEIISEQQPYVFLFHEENYVVATKNLKNFTIYADGRYSSLTKAYKE